MENYAFDPVPGCYRNALPQNDAVINHLSENDEIITQVVQR